MLLCSGKIFYGLDQGREERDWDGIAIIRLEQLYPFPAAELTEPRSATIRAPPTSAWVQEEPANQGAWSFVRGRIEALLRPGAASDTSAATRPRVPRPAATRSTSPKSRRIVEQALKRPRTGRASRAAEPPPVPSDMTRGSRP